DPARSALLKSKVPRLYVPPNVVGVVIGVRERGAGYRHGAGAEIGRRNCRESLPQRDRIREAIGRQDELRRKVRKILAARLGMTLEKDRVGDHAVPGSDDGRIGEAVRQPQSRGEMQTVPSNATVGGSGANTADHHGVVPGIIEFDAGAGAPGELEVVRAKAITHSQLM